MKGEEVIEIPNGLSEQVKHAIKKVGIYGLDLEKAQELGVIDRISYMLCLMHTCISAGNMVFADVGYMLDILHGKRHEIGNACNQFERSFEKFMSFWSTNYQSLEGVREMNKDTEDLYHQVMRWAKLRENWGLGEPIHTNTDTDTIVKIDLGDREIKIKRTNVDSETIGEVEESWCVTKLDMKTKQQTTVYTNMDRSSAQMSAKRLSAEDKDNIYTATILQTITEKRTDALPMKAYMGGDVAGRIGKEFRT